MYEPPSNEQKLAYEQEYAEQIRQLGLTPDPRNNRQILGTTHLEITGLHKYMNSANNQMSEHARQKAADRAVEYANSLAKKIKAEIQGPLHPSNVETQIRQNLYHVQAQYEGLLLRLDHPDNAFAYGRINNHPDINRNWAEYASSFVDLINPAVPLVRNHYL